MHLIINNCYLLRIDTTNLKLRIQKNILFQKNKIQITKTKKQIFLLTY
jgi:hypothetical protein